MRKNAVTPSPPFFFPSMQGAGCESVRDVSPCARDRTNEGTAHRKQKVYEGICRVAEIATNPLKTTDILGVSVLSLNDVFLRLFPLCIRRQIPSGSGSAPSPYSAGVGTPSSEAHVFGPTMPSGTIP